MWYNYVDNNGAGERGDDDGRDKKKELTNWTRKESSSIPTHAAYFYEIIDPWCLQYYDVMGDSL